MAVTEAKIAELTKNQKVAIIYSKNDLNEYYVEFRSQDTNEFCRKGDDVEGFICLDDAKDKARAAGITTIFLALENVYDEFGKDEIIDRFSYMPLIAPANADE